MGPLCYSHRHLQHWLASAAAETSVLKRSWRSGASRYSQYWRQAWQKHLHLVRRCASTPASAATCVNIQQLTSRPALVLFASPGLTTCLALFQGSYSLARHCATFSCATLPQAQLAAGVLAAVAGRPRAAQVLLAAHSARLKRAQQQLLKPQNTGMPGNDPIWDAVSA